MNFFNSTTLFLLSCLATLGRAQEASSENIYSDLLLHPELPCEEISYKKRYLYGSLSLAPGGGLSFRKRDGCKGKAFDVKIGMTNIYWWTSKPTLIPVVMADYNFLHYTKMKEISPYFSYGIGAAYIIPYMPLRAGIEFNHGFIDVGVKVLPAFIPLPEVRGGIGIEF